MIFLGFVNIYYIEIICKVILKGKPDIGKYDWPALFIICYTPYGKELK